MSLPDLLFLALATWRVAYMVTAESGPGQIFISLRAHDFTGVTECLYCASVWISFLAVILWHYDLMILVYPFSVSGLAIMAKHFTGAGFNG